MLMDKSMLAMPPADEWLAEYINAAISRAVYEILPDGTHYGEIPGFRGVYANADSREDCGVELRDVLEGWLILGLELGHPLPELPEINLAIDLVMG